MVLGLEERGCLSDGMRVLPFWGRVTLGRRGVAIRLLKLRSPALWAQYYHQALYGMTGQQRTEFNETNDHDCDESAGASAAAN